MTRRNKKTGLIIALVIFLAAAGFLAWFFYEQYIQVSDVKDLKGQSILALHEQNEDCIGWIEVKGTDIDYPVMMGPEYLHMNFDKEYSFPGLPFVTERWNSDVSNTLIYGHNMWTGGMFHDLQGYLEKEYYEEHKEIIFWCICEGEEGLYVEGRKYEPFATVETHIARWAYQDYANKVATDRLPKYIDEINERAEYETGITPKGENLLTLSTCSHRNYGKKGRVVVISDFWTV